MEPVALTREVQAFLVAYKKIFGEIPKVVVECGARDFLETTLFSQLNPEGRIYSFECNPFTLPTCRERLTKLPNVELIEKAVSDKDGKLSFYPTDPLKTESKFKDGNPGASSLFKASPNYTREKYVQNEITVTATRLDTFISEKGIHAIDAMWMDIQGAELMALRGLGNSIHDVGLIYLEVEFFEIYQGQPLFADLKQFLNEQGFQLWGFTNFYSFYADAIFINKHKVHGLMKLRLLISDAFAYLYRKRFDPPLQFILNLARVPYRAVRKFLRGAATS
jgi:FkbM family methyltransferase